VAILDNPVVNFDLHSEIGYGKTLKDLPILKKLLLKQVTKLVGRTFRFKLPV
jgi:hypothetical protein